MKRLFMMPSDVATIDCTSTLAPGPNTTPDGLEMTTVPPALMEPRICDAPPFSTRLRAAMKSSWTKSTELPSPTLKVSHSMITRSEPWMIVTELSP